MRGLVPRGDLSCSLSERVGSTLRRLCEIFILRVRAPTGRGVSADYFSVINRDEIPRALPAKDADEMRRPATRRSKRPIYHQLQLR